VIEAKDTTTVPFEKKEGTGFLAEIKGRTFIVTNQHVIDGVAQASDLKVHKLDGSEMKIGRVYAAVDHDLALLECLLPKDDHDYRWEFIPDTSTLQSGDAVVAIGNPLGGGTLLESKGSILGIGPRLIELNIAVFHGNSGGPVFLPSSGKVIGIVTKGESVSQDDWFDRISAQRPDSPIRGDVRTFATRFDSISAWQEVRWPEWAAQKKALETHVKRIRALWSIAKTSVTAFTIERDQVIEVPELWSLYQNYELQMTRAKGVDEKIALIKFMIMAMDGLCSPHGAFRSELETLKKSAYSWNKTQRTDEPWSVEFLEQRYQETYLRWKLNRETIQQQLKLAKINESP